MSKNKFYSLTWILSSWSVASFFHLFQQITKQLFLSKLWIYYMHINMLCYTTLPQQQNCFVNFESLTTILHWTFVNENMFTEAHPHMQNSWVVFLVNNVTNTRYKVKIDESTTTSKFYNLFQYNFCKKNLWVGAGKKTAQPWKKGWLDQQQPLVSQAIIISWSCNSNGSLGWCLIIFAVDDLAPSSLYFDSCCRLNWF